MLSPLLILCICVSVCVCMQACILAHYSVHVCVYLYIVAYIIFSVVPINRITIGNNRLLGNFFDCQYQLLLKLLYQLIKIKIK